MFDAAQIDNWFTHHPPTSDQVGIYEAVRAHAREFAHVLNALVPDGADKSDALRKLREVVMTANAGIATATPEAPKRRTRSAPVRKTPGPKAASPADTRTTAAMRANPRAQTALWPQPSVDLPLVPKTATRRRATPPSINDLTDQYLANL